MHLSNDTAKTSILDVTSISENATFKIYNIIGQTIMKGKLSNNSINVSSVAEGNYLLEITYKGVTTTKRFIKEKYFIKLKLKKAILIR